MGEIQEVNKMVPTRYIQRMGVAAYFLWRLVLWIKECLGSLFKRSLNKKKTIEEAIDIIETFASNEYFYASDRTQKRGVIALNPMDALLAQNKLITAQLAALTKQIEKNKVSTI